MNAVIILHGLFLLLCNKDASKPTCDVVVPYTYPGSTAVYDDASQLHDYKVGYSLNLKDIPQSNNLKIKGLAGASTSPYDSGIEQRLFKIRANYVAAKARSVISGIPWPDMIIGLNKHAMEKTEAINSDPDVGGLIESKAVKDTGGTERFTTADTVILYYKQGAAFSMVDGTSTWEIKSTNFNGKSEVLVFYSWPKNYMPPMDHTAGFNSMLTRRTTSTAPITLRLTGNKNSVRAPDETQNPVANLPPAITRPPGWEPEALPLNKKQVKAHDEVFVSYGREGCGIILTDGP